MLALTLASLGLPRTNFFPVISLITLTRSPSSASSSCSRTASVGVFGLCANAASGLEAGVGAGGEGGDAVVAGGSARATEATRNEAERTTRVVRRDDIGRDDVPARPRIPSAN